MYAKERLNAETMEALTIKKSRKEMVQRAVVAFGRAIEMACKAFALSKTDYCYQVERPLKEPMRANRV